MSLIGALKGVANTAAGLAPYAQQAMLAQKQRDDADKQRMLAQLHQMSQDSTASVNATAAYGLNAAQQAHLGAQTDALRHPPTSLTYRMNENGEYEGMPTKMSGAPPAANPLTAGPKVIGDGSEPQQPTQQPGITPIATGVKGAQPLVKVQDVPGGPVRYVTSGKAVGANAPTPPDPNSLASIAAAGKKAGAIAAAKAPYAAPRNVPLVKTVGPDGTVTYTPAPQAAGMNAPTTGAGAAGGGAKQQQLDALAGDIEQSIPIMTRLSPKVSGARVSLAMSHPDVGNLVLSDDEKSYVTAARTFLAGVLHLESGARLSKEQWDIGRQRYLPLPDDPEAVKQQKLSAALETARQRPRSTGGRGGSPPNVPHPANPDDRPGPINLAAPHVQTIDEMIKAGKSDAEIKAALAGKP